MSAMDRPGSSFPRLWRDTRLTFRQRWGVALRDPLYVAITAAQLAIVVAILLGWRP